MKDVFTDDLTSDEYAALSDEGKGYVSYIQGAHNPDVPDAAPAGCDMGAFARGQQRAIIDVLEVEE